MIRPRGDIHSSASSASGVSFYVFSAYGARVFQPPEFSMDCLARSSLVRRVVLQSSSRNGEMRGDSHAQLMLVSQEQVGSSAVGKRAISDLDIEVSHTNNQAMWEDGL